MIYTERMLLPSGLVYSSHLTACSYEEGDSLVWSSVICKYSGMLYNPYMSDWCQHVDECITPSDSLTVVDI